MTAPEPTGALVLQLRTDGTADLCAPDGTPVATGSVEEMAALAEQVTAYAVERAARP